MGYVPNLQVGGQVSNFMRDHLGYDISSPAILERIGTAFRLSVSGFAEDEHVPVASPNDRACRSSLICRCQLARLEPQYRQSAPREILASQ
jgi:hypothetical protein